VITLYGIADSRAFRCLWMLEELGCEYRHVPTDFTTGCKTPEFLRLNPNGRIPCLVDGDLVLFESLAINLYLARRHSSPLWPSGIADEARLYQWTLWATNELDPHLSTLARQSRIPEDARDPVVIDVARAALAAPFRVLDAHLSSAPYLLGAEASLADINVASVATTALVARYDLRPAAHVDAWLKRCLTRPAARRAIALALAPEPAAGAATPP
jgi:glutathione S-transferase